MIKDVVLLQNDKEISGDPHQGWAGAAAHDTAYTLKFDKAMKGAKYTLKAQVRSDGGTDSTGTLYVKQPPRPDRK